MEWTGSWVDVVCRFFFHTFSVFCHCALLQPYSGQIDEIVKNWVDYKIKVPVYGGILLNPTLDKVWEGGRKRKRGEGRGREGRGRAVDYKIFLYSRGEGKGGEGG
jgi:hypothetical protein